MKQHYISVNEQPEIATAYHEWSTFLSIAYGSFDGSADVFIIHTYLSVFAKLNCLFCYHSSAGSR